MTLGGFFSGGRVLGLGQAALEGEEDKIGAAADAKLVQEIGNMEFDGALGDVEPAGDLFVGKILKERIEDFLLAAAEIGDGIGLEAAPLAGEYGIDKAREQLARNPESTVDDKGQSTNQLVACLGIGEEALHAKPEERVAIGIIVLLPDDDEPRLGITFKNIGKQSAGSGSGSMRVNDVHLRAGRLHVAKVGGEHGCQLLGDYLELRLFEKSLELAQHQGVRRQQTNG
jgi:hypothetical protein